MSILNTQALTAVSFNRLCKNSPQRSWSSLWLYLIAFSMIVTGLPAYAVTRDISITSPTTAVVGSKVAIVVAARTDAGGGEQIGFFHADYSTDGGLTWTAISYAKNTGSKASYSTTFAVKEADKPAIVRVRVAFRGGKAGDVDYTGKSIDWDGSWKKWQEPPSKIATIAVVAK